MMCSVVPLLLLCLVIFEKSSAIPLSSQKHDDDNNSLQLVQILFRHGDRTTDPVTIYPKDPYINETYHPFGKGELNNMGKKRAFGLGKLLKHRYRKFLGDIYTPDLLEGISSENNRTKTSLQLVLAGLFPPVGDLIWGSDLLWQPIPTNYIRKTEDNVFYGIYCPNFERFYKEYQTSPKILQEYRQYQRSFEYLSENTGWNVTNYSKIFLIAFCLQTEEEWGLELPEWTRKIYPEPLKHLLVQFYKSLTGNTRLKKIAAGYLLKRIVDNIKLKVNGVIPNKKLFLYSGHELNLAVSLITLDLFDNKVPEYASSLIYELHKVEGTYGLKLFYQNGIEDDWKLLKLPDCDQLCPVNKFLAIVKNYLPLESDCGAKTGLKPPASLFR